MDKRTYIEATDVVAERLQQALREKTDIQSERLKRLLALPDLSRTEGSPIKFIVDAVCALPMFETFDVMRFPEIVSVKNNFDLLNSPADHPSRKETDTYYLNHEYVLRTQTTTMWPFYLSRPEIIRMLQETGSIGLLSFGKVYRKDEIDRNHFPVFHQVDGLYICKKEIKQLGIPELQEILSTITKAVYGDTITYRFLEDTFPFTDPSTQIEIQRDNQWLEVVGAGVVHTQVLQNLGIDPKQYNGWAFGFGLERLAMAKMNINDIRVFWSTDPRITQQFKNLQSQYQEVSKYPMTYRDISFIVGKDVSLNTYYEIVRDCVEENIIEEVKMTDTYENKEKFGPDNISYTFRIVYRSPERTLTNEEVNTIQDKIIKRTREELHADIR